jgi:hypothetical protein
MADDLPQDVDPRGAGTPATHPGARLVTGRAGRGAAFAIDFFAALIRAARGRPEHPEERGVEVRS